MDNQQTLLKQVIALLDGGRHKDAVALAHQIKEETVRAALLIDTGASMKKSTVIREGIELLEKALNDNLSPFTNSSLMYNAANGYSELYNSPYAQLGCAQVGDVNLRHEQTTRSLQ